MKSPAPDFAALVAAATDGSVAAGMRARAVQLEELALAIADPDAAARVRTLAATRWKVATRLEQIAS